MGTAEGRVSSLRVRVLGRIEAIVDQPTSLGGPTQRRLFAALVARRGEIVSVPELVEICWPDSRPPHRAEHNVRTYVHRLRSALGADGHRIETAGVGYRLMLERGELDSERFEELAGIAERLAEAGEVADALDRMREAEALWAGRPYAEFADDPWALAEVARLTELHWVTNERLAETLLKAGQPENAVTLLEAMIRDEPLRERPRSLLMQALYESGRGSQR